MNNCDVCVLTIRTIIIILGIYYHKYLLAQIPYRLFFCSCSAYFLLAVLPALSFAMFQCSKKAKISTANLFESICPPVTIYHFLFHSKITFGGMPFSGKPSSNSRKNFKGCMESINYNGNNITDLAKRKKLEPSNVVRASFNDHLTFCSS